jgi:hypothetical protein
MLLARNNQWVDVVFVGTKAVASQTLLAPLLCRGFGTITNGVRYNLSANDHAMSATRRSPVLPSVNQRTKQYLTDGLRVRRGV